MKKNRLLAVLLIISLLAMLAPSALAGEEVVELQVLTYNDDFYDTVIEDFERLNPDIKVIRKLGQGIDTGATAAMLTSEDAPDVLMCNSGPGRVLPLAEAGLLEDLTPYYESRGWGQVVNPSILAIMNENDDQLWEICNGMDVFSVYYHVPTFEQFGLEPPTTLAELEVVMETLKEGGVTPFIVGGRDNYQLGWAMGNFYQSLAGRDFITSLIYGDGSFTDDAFKGAESKFLEYFEKGYFNEDMIAISGEEAHTSWAMGQAAMCFSGQGNLQSFIDQGILDWENFSSFPFPSALGEQSIPTAGMAHSWVVPVGTEKLEYALRWMDYVASLDYQVCLGGMSAWTYGIGAIEIEDLSVLNLNPMVNRAFEQLADGVGYNPSVYLLGNLKSVYYETNQELFSKTKTVDEIGEALQASKEEYLASKAQ